MSQLLWINGKGLEFECEASRLVLVKEILESFVKDILPAQWNKRWRWWPPGFERTLVIPHGGDLHYCFAAINEGHGAWLVCEPKDRMPVELLLDPEIVHLMRIYESSVSLGQNQGLKHHAASRPSGRGVERN